MDMYCMLYVCFALHCLHEYPSNVSSSFTVITKHKYLYFGLQRTFSINNHSRCCNIISSHYSDFKFIKYTKIKSTNVHWLLARIAIKCKYFSAKDLLWAFSFWAWTCNRYLGEKYKRTPHCLQNQCFHLILKTD